MVMSEMAGYTVYTYLMETLRVYTREKWIFLWYWCGTESHSATKPDALNLTSSI